jgi:hypothetical protein
MLRLASQRNVLGLPPEFNSSNIQQYFPHTCSICAVFNITTTSPTPTPKFDSLSMVPGAVVQLDILGPLDRGAIPLSYGNYNQLLVIVDIATDFTFIIPLQSSANLLPIIQSVLQLFIDHSTPIQKLLFDDQFNQTSITTYLNSLKIQFEVARPKNIP